MSARHRDNKPPYEIMGQRPVTPQAPGRGPRPGAGPGAGLGGVGRSLIEAWRTGASEPMVLRVPRGVAVGLLAGLVGLLVLSYWVGYSRGDSSAQRRVRAEYEPALTDSGRVPPPRYRSDGAGTGVQGGAISPQGYDDPRVPGRNYLVLALYPPDEARRLQAFLAGRQVDVMVGLRNNKELSQVIALNGFTREQMRDSDAEETFKAKLRGLGREWKAANGGKGDDLSSMYFDRYEPPAGL